MTRLKFVKHAWLVFSLDLFLVLFSLLVSYGLRFNFSIPRVEYNTFYFVFPFVVTIRALFFILTKSFRGIIQYIASGDAFKIFYALLLGSIVFILVNGIGFVVAETFALPFSILIIEFVLTTFFLLGYRIAIKFFLYDRRPLKGNKTDVVIFGAGNLGVTTKRALDRDRGTRYNIIGFLDDNPSKWKSNIEGIPIYGTSEFDQLIVKHNISHLIISVLDLNIDKKRKLVEVCLNHNITVRSVPPVMNWINGELSYNQIKHVQIEDVLGRDEIKLNQDKIAAFLKDKCILITGGAGSIGSEIVRQLIHYPIKKLILLDCAESDLYRIQQEMIVLKVQHICTFEIGNIRDKQRMQYIFSYYKPDYVFHAAAYKHVPLMEQNPSEALLTNVMGTKLLADLAVEYHCEKFIMISTDKAVNPTNVMGASKRLAEVYVQALSSTVNKPLFITTRFGNVLGSNGSVIPLFREQIERGGPITVTHPEVTRYFMTIPEACQLVLEAALMGKGEEIFVFDMGKPVKIIDLAKQMIRLSGLELGKDIEIVFTQLREGEKLYEELITDKENALPTHHDKIMRAKISAQPFEQIELRIKKLNEALSTSDHMRTVKLLKEIIPEFQSKNSVYEKLDKPAQA